MRVIPRFINKNEIDNDSIVIDFGCSIDRGLFVLFENESVDKWIGLFKKGGNDYNKIKLFADDKVLIFANGQGFIVNTKSKTQIKLDSCCYTDSFINSNFVFLASYTLIDIYSESGFIKQLQIDDIDGVRFMEKNTNRLKGEFLQISSVNPNDWLPFEIDLSSFELFCDDGRMWEEVTIKEGKLERKYMTMELRK